MGLEGLNDHRPVGAVAPGAPGDLGDEAEGALRGPEVGKHEAGVGLDDADELHPGEVQALRHHLRAEQDVDVATAEGIEGFLEDAFLAGGVGVEAADGEIAKARLHLLLDALGAVSGEPGIEGAALGADARRLLRVSAVVADHLSLRLVVGEGHRAVFASKDEAAGAALEEGGKAPAVEKEDGLPPRPVGLAHGLDEGRRERSLRAGEAHHLHPRHGAA